MTYFSPSQIHAVFDEVHRLKPGWFEALGGIMGNAEHFANGGYHVPRNALRNPSDDYSDQLSLDRNGGNGDAASALDLSPVGANGRDIMRIMTGNLNKYRHHPIMVRYIREFAGTLDNRTVFAIDLPTGRQTGSQWDTSHLYHVHLSFYRSRNQLVPAKALARIITGNVTTHGNGY